MAGNVGLLGADYPGYYPCADERALAAALARAESDQAFFRTLEAGVAARRALTDPAAERRAIAALIAELVVDPPNGA